MKDSMRNIKRVAEDGTGPLNKRPHRQGKPLRKRAERVALPDGRFRFSDEQWRDIEQLGFPSDARYRIEITVTIFRNNLAEEADAVPPAKTRQHLRRLSTTAETFLIEFQGVINDCRAWELITCLPDCPALRLCRLEQDLLGLSDVLTKAADAVELGPPGAAPDWNLFGFVSDLAALWEEYTGARFNRTKKRPTERHAIDFIIAVGRIADPHLHQDTLENVVRSVAEKRLWEN
jgi:hypothetical protein